MSNTHEVKRKRIAALVENLHKLSAQLEVLDSKPVEGSGMIREARLKNLDYSLDSMENTVRCALDNFK